MTEVRAPADDTPAGETPPEETSTEVDGSRRRPGRRGLGIGLTVLVAIVVSVLVRAFVVQAFYIPSGSMENTLHVGDRVLVSKLGSGAGSLHRGDVIVFNGTGTFAPEVTPATGPTARLSRWVGSLLGMAPSEHDFVKRVIGLPGDRVVCCAADGRLTVNGTPVDEPYLFPSDKPSELRFDITVPAGRLWVMGDHRSDSADSRAHLGDPGGGTVPESRVIGKVVAVYWPLGRIGGLPSAGAVATSAFAGAGSSP